MKFEIRMLILNRSLVSLIIASLILTNTQAQVKSRLADNWEFIRQDIGGIWEAVRPVKKR